jgi:hypothetical protein
LFGKTTVIPTFAVGSHLRYLCDKLGGLYTPELLIQKHTLLPFYFPFIPKERKEEILYDITYADGKGVYTKLGIVAGSVCEKRDIYYCSSCVKNDREQFGEAYIHRIHQLQGVMICPKHRQMLLEYPFKTFETSRIEYIRFDENLLERLPDLFLLKDKHEQLSNVAKAASFLMEHDLSHVNKSHVLMKYKNLLYERNLTTNKLSIKQHELHEQFVSYYGVDLLNYFKSDLDPFYEYNWLRVATRNVSRTVHPLRHILLIQFLTGDMDTFFTGITAQEITNPFGKGPWPCLNKASEHYQRNVINQLKIMLLLGQHGGENFTANGIRG